MVCLSCRRLPVFARRTTDWDLNAGAGRETLSTGVQKKPESIGWIMPLRGRAFLPMWFGLAEGFEREFDRWHTIEHMPERLGVPGFLRGRRYMHARGSDRTVFQLYEGRHIETFRSPGYLARLNAPTEWSNRVSPGLVKFIRGACQTMISLGEGVGGALVTVRIAVGVADRAEAGQSLTAAAPAIAKLHGITAVHVGEHLPHITKVETAETRLRPPATAAEFDFVLLVEGISVPDLDGAITQLLDLVGVLGTGSLQTDAYRLAYLLEEEG